MVLIENRLVIKENCVLGVDILGTALKKSEIFRES
jgi:hypothetical protein